MTTKHHSTHILAFSLLAIILIQGCKKQDETDNYPEISNYELGLNNSHIAYAGADLHIEGSIIALNNILDIQISIQPAFNQNSARQITSAWIMDTTYLKFEGLKNTLFHEHLDIPSDADTGYYQILFTITDFKGYQLIIEDQFHIEIPSDTIAPFISAISVPDSSIIYHNNDTINISTLVTDDIGLGGLYIGLIRLDQQLPDSLITFSNNITLLHKHEFTDPDEFNESTSIVVGCNMDNNDPPKPIEGEIAWQTGDYYILIKAIDAFGSNITYSHHFPVKISIQ